MSVLPPAIAPTASPESSDEAPAPKRRGRPRKVIDEAAAAE
jgi:AT hook motif